MASSSQEVEGDDAVDLERIVPALRERLGPEATGGLVALLNEARKEWTTEMIGVVTDRFERRLVEETSKLRVEMAQGFATLRQAIADQQFEILKWAFLFWIGQFFAVASLVAVLIRFLRN